MWYALKSGAPASAYNIGEYIRIFGAIDPALFETALRHVVGETEAICVRFVERDDIPRQLVMAPTDWCLTYRDVSSEPDPISAAEAWMRADMAQPFDLHRGPFFVYALFKTEPAEFLWYVRYHHLVMDAYGASLIARRVAEVYSALAAGSNADFSPLGSLAGLVEEDAAYRASGQFKSDRQYWLDSMPDCPEPLSLSIRTPAVPDQYLRQTANLPSAAVEQLQHLARRMDLTFPQIVMLSTAIFIHRLTEAEDVVIGQFMTARMSPIARQTPAMVTNVVPLRLEIQPDTRVEDLAVQVRRKVRTGMRHLRYRIADLRRDLRRIDRPFIRQCVGIRPFDYDLQFAGSRSTNHLLANGPVDDLNVHLFSDPSEQGAWRVEFDANPALYDREFVACLQRRFLRLLTTMSDPAELVGRLDILPPDERRQIPVEWNDTGSDYPRDRRVHELFEAQAQRTPDRVAVVCEQQRLTYRELNAQADRLAHHLALLGVGPDERVGLHVERSLGMVVGLLGILKAGGAYVPLDPNYPQDRLAFILGDSQPAVLLTQQSLRNRLRPRNAAILCLDALPALPTDIGHAQSTGSRPAGELAYVLYTSGSTGQPKGAEIPHRALVNFLKAMQHKPGIAAEDRLLSVTSLSFDIAGLELFLPLIAGAQVTIAPSDVTADGFRLAALMQACGATVMQATPATWRLLLEAGWEGSQSLKILCGGEAWPTELASALLPRCASLWNMYGPTETTVWSAVARIERDQRVLIGLPIANTTFYVLDRYSQPVPVGVPGELYIGGDGVARGYLNRPELTAERFVADPFSREPAARMYKTGDRVRRLPDGRLEFLGRLDHQVKIRGYRIELGEIEAALRLHPAVQDAVVAARDDGTGDKRLVAYVTASGPASVPTGELRSLLREKLPAYMLPSAFVPLDAFPVTPNGKVDRKALPIPDEPSRDTGDGYVGPRTPMEQLVADVWRQLFNLKQVGVHDNFFDLGGDSLLALQLDREIERATGHDLPMTAIYDAPTVAGMAAILAGQTPGSRFSPVVLLNPGTESPPVFIVHGVGGSAMELIPLARSMRCGHPVYGFQAQGLDGTEAPNDRVEAMAEYYVAAMTELQPHGPYVLVGLCFGGLVAIEIARRLLERGEPVALLALLETYPHPRSWPLRSQIATLMIQPLRRHWRALKIFDSREAVQYAKTLLPRMFRRLKAHASGDNIGLTTDPSLPPAVGLVFDGGIAALRDYRPRYYPGKVNYLKCEINTMVPRDPFPVWARLVRELEIQSVPGDHPELVSTYASDVAAWLSSRVRDAVGAKVTQATIDRDRGTPRGATAPAPPDLRVMYHGDAAGSGVGRDIEAGSAKCVEEAGT